MKQHLQSKLWRAIRALTAALCLVSPLQAQEQIDPEKLKMAIEALNRLKGIDLEGNPRIKTNVLKVLNATKGTPQFVQITRDFNISGQNEELLKLAIANSTNSTGADAIRLILDTGETNLIAGALKGPQGRQTANALGSAASRKGGPLLQAVVGDPNAKAETRQAAARALTRTEEGAAWLLDQARQKKLSDDLLPIAKLELSNVPWAAVKAAAAELFITTESAHAIPPIAELVKMKGDAKRGADIFKRPEVACAMCHQVNDVGVDFGPKLSEIGTKLGKDALYQSIIEPNLGIAFGYEAWSLETKDGEEAFGLIVSETADELSLKTQSGITTAYKKKDLVKREKQTLSLMPAGLEQTMSLQELVDLVEYLASLKKPAI